MKDNLSFLIYEYKNYIASMLYAYDYVYSARYGRDHNIYTEIITQNFINIAKSSLSLVERDLFKTHLGDNSLWNIFDYRMRVHKLRYLIKDMIIGKIDLYSCLYSKQVDYKVLSAASKTLNDYLTSTKKELNVLLDTGPRNVKLCREAIMYELCVLEKTYISSRLRNLYTEALEDNRNRVGSIKSAFMK